MPASAEGSSSAQDLVRASPTGGLGGILARGIGLFPRGALPTLGAFVAWLAGTLLRVRRQHVERAMKRAGITRSRASSVAWAMYRSLGSSLVELLWLAAHPETPASQLASLDEYSRAVLAEARERHRGVVLATAHAGNWELAAAAFAETGPLTVIVKQMSVGWVERFCQAVRRSRGISLALPERALARSRDALARGETVAMLIDQVPARASHALQTEFLCGSTDVDRSPAALAAATGALLVVAVSRRVGPSAQVLEILAVLDPPPRGANRRTWTEEATRTATRLLERWVHAHPAEWLWMHRRWRKAPGKLRPQIAPPLEAGAPGEAWIAEAPSARTPAPADP